MPHPVPSLRSERLILRPWMPEDRAPFAAMNADPQVMAYFPACLDREQSDALAARIEAHFAEHGYGWWALEVPGEESFIGYVGLQVVDFPAAFAPAVAIGWRLAQAHWELGYAHEGAERVLDYAFDELGLEEVVAFTVPDNRNSLGLMQRLGMRRDPAADFEHPHLPRDHRLRHHQLYRLRAGEWRRE